MHTQKISVARVGHVLIEAGSPIQAGVWGICSNRSRGLLLEVLWYVSWSVRGRHMWCCSLLLCVLVECCARSSRSRRYRRPLSPTRPRFDPVMCSPRGQGLGLRAPRGQKIKSWSWSCMVLKEKSWSSSRQKVSKFLKHFANNRFEYFNRS